MTLGQKQRLFTRLVGKLIAKAYREGFELSLGYAERSPQENRRIGGHPRSLHTKRLAIDLNLFKNGRYLRTTKAHKPLGEWWERQHPLCRWGGRFGDGNHYSMTHGGIQ